MSDVFSQAEVNVEETPSLQQVAEAQPQVAINENNQNVFAVEYKGKTWKTEEVLNKFQNADSYIEQLKLENEELKKKIIKETNVEQVLQQITTQGTVDNTSVQKEAHVANTPVDVEEVAKSVFQRLQQETQEAKNIEECSRLAFDAYGDKAFDVLVNKGKELGMTLEEVKALSARKPAAFAKLFIEKQQQQVAPITKGTVNTQTLKPQAANQVKVSQLKSGRDLAAYAMSKLKQN